MLKIGTNIIFAVNACLVLSAVRFLIFVLASNELPVQWTHLLTWEEIGTLSPTIIAATKYMAILFYSLCIGYGVLIHMVTWKDLRKGQQWALWTIGIAWEIVATVMFTADLAFGGLLFPLHTIYNASFLTGIVIAGFGLYKSQEHDKVDETIAKYREDTVQASVSP